MPEQNTITWGRWVLDADGRAVRSDLADPLAGMDPGDYGYVLGYVASKVEHGEPVTRETLAQALLAAARRRGAEAGESR